MNSFHRILPLSLLFLLTIQIPGIAQIQEGDTLSFWSVSYIDWDPGYPVEQRQVSAVCSRVGEHCYVFIDTAVLSPPSQDRIDTLVEVYDTNFSQNLPPLYGPIPDEFDNDPRIFILIIFELSWSGYFDPAQQMADSVVYRLWEKHSSEREIIYITPQCFGYNSEQMVVAHELGHMIHWGQDHSPEPPEDPVIFWEDAWIDEGFANFAPVYLIEDVTVPDLYDPGAFFAIEPDLPLIHFISQYNYNMMKLWSTFMYEHYGEGDFMSTLISDQENGIPGVRNTLAGLGYPESFEETFEHWVLANYLDDPDYEGGWYSYHHYNFPACRLSSNHSVYPTGPWNRTVSPFAVDYIAFNENSPGPITIEFSGDSTSIFRLSAILLDRFSSETIGIESISLDSMNRGTFYSDDFGSAFDQVVLAVMNVDSSLGEEEVASYTYMADAEMTGIVDDPRGNPSGRAPVMAFALDQNYPNPFNPSTTISFDIPGGPGDHRSTNLSIYDLRGRRIRTLVDRDLEAGRHQVVWDGRDEQGRSIAAGVYIYTLASGDQLFSRKMTILK